MAPLEPFWRIPAEWVASLRMPRIGLARHLAITGFFVGVIIWWLL